MNYLESIAYLDGLAPTLEKPTLDRIAAFFEEYGNPQNCLPCFHVGGTNGKGSTVAILASVLQKCGLSVGRFTGPHLLRWNERFQINEVPIPDFQFAQYATRLKSMSEEFACRHPELGPLTWFEFITAIACQYFAEQKVDVAVIEVGLGGRFDATNVIANVLASVITNVDLDHTHILGETVDKIALEKAGIIKAGIPVVTAVGGTALRVIADRAWHAGAPLFVAELPRLIFPVPSGSQKSAAQPPALFSSSAFNNEIERQLQACRFDEAPCSLVGAHQKLNALLAFAALHLCQYRIESNSSNSSNSNSQEQRRVIVETLQRQLPLAWAPGLAAVYWQAAGSR